MPSRRAVSTTARTASLPRRCPSMRGSPRRRAQRPLPSMMIATCRGSRLGSRSTRDIRNGSGVRLRASGRGSGGSLTEACSLKPEAYSNRENLLLLTLENFVDTLEILLGGRLDLVACAPAVVLGEVLFLEHLLQQL